MAGGSVAGYRPPPDAALNVFGWDNYFDSTEILRTIDGTWTQASKLPRAMDGLRGVTLGNKVYMLGSVQFLHSVEMTLVDTEVSVRGCNVMQI